MPASRLSEQRSQTLNVRDIGLHSTKRTRGLAAVACLLLLTACTATAQTDWQKKIGRYSLDDVTRELGRPESCVGLDDGGTACSWLTAREKERVDKLILTFSPNGKLATSNQVHF